MKKLIFFLILVTLLVTLIACNGTDGKDDITTEKPLVVLMTDAASPYSIVYPLSYSSTNFKGQAVEYLEELIKTNAGNALKTKSDYLADGESASSYEILLGSTNRPESAEALKTLRYDDYLIGFVNEKLVVIGGSDEASAKAIRHFATMFFSKTQNALILPEDYCERFDGSYPVSSLTFFGNSAADCVILSDSATEQDALYLQKSLRALSGYTLPIVESATQGYTITLSAGSDTNTVTESGITLAHSDPAERSRRINALVKTLSSLGKDAALDASTALLRATDGEKLSLIDLNLYSTGYAENAITKRYPRLMTYLASKSYPDILTLQDVSPTWVSQFDLSGEGYKAMNEVYGYVGRGRNDDKDSVMQAIFYKKDTFTLVDSGTFWLSETPDRKSVGWDGRTRSICTWAILKTADGNEIAVMNTMLDPYGTKARANGMALILNFASETFTCPVLFCGDLQTEPKKTVPKSVTKCDFFDAETIAESGNFNSEATTNQAFGNISTFKTKSDYVFTSYGDFKVNAHALDKTKVDDAYISNHWILYTDLTLINYQ
ncbi:MAG: hypothetical protein IJW46_07745 [Clostridia bacterium]|nr:hypothetical protein [Clostridia bacterium]